MILAGLLSGLVSPPADLLVSPDARLIALRSPAFLQTRPGFSRFVLDAWKQYWAEALASAVPRRRRRRGRCAAIWRGAASSRAAPWCCSRAACTPMDCAGAALVVSAEPARAVCPALPRIDRFTVWRDGAQAVWLRNGVATVVSDRAWRGERPWAPPPPAAQAARVTQPLALEE